MSASPEQHAAAQGRVAAQHERERYATVMQHESAKGRFALAMALLAATEGNGEPMSVESIIKALNAAPLPQIVEAPAPAPAPAPASPLNTSLANELPPDVLAAIRQRAIALNMTESQITWEIDYARGEAAARALGFGKK